MTDELKSFLTENKRTNTKLNPSDEALIKIAYSIDPCEDIINDCWKYSVPYKKKQRKEHPIRIDNKRVNLHRYLCDYLKEPVGKSNFMKKKCKCVDCVNPNHYVVKKYNEEYRLPSLYKGGCSESLKIEFD